MGRPVKNILHRLQRYLTAKSEIAMHYLVADLAGVWG